ncbi:hypothetical protein [Krasilnikovia cinnamomea]|nr:hypothetical protein [Krasilnikovia cinnamomea]
MRGRWRAGLVSANLMAATALALPVEQSPGSAGRGAQPVPRPGRVDLR